MPELSFEADRLDDQDFLASRDPSGMLPAVAFSARQVRAAYRTALESGAGSVAADGRPRAIVVLGVGTSALAGEVLAATCGYGCPVPIVTVRDHRLPGWVGVADLVVAVSRSGRTEETLEATAQAVRRGCRLLAVGAPDSPLQALAEQASGPFVPAVLERRTRAALWELALPPLVAASALGLVRLTEEVVEAAARRLEEVAYRCRPTSESFVNPAKTLALELADTLPVIWGSSALAGVAAHRLACQLHENAKYPALWGALPEAGRGQLGVFDGALAERDVFADAPSRTLRLFVLRDVEEHPRDAQRRAAVLRLAEERSIPAGEIPAEGVHPLERLAGLVALGDFASVYLALGYGLDPTPVPALVELEARSA